MKKNYYCRIMKWFKHHFYRIKFLFVLPVLLVFMVPSVYCMEQKITIQMENVSIQTFLDEMKELSGMNILYNAELFNGLNSISVSVKNEEWKDVLKNVLEDVGMEYSINNNIVVIKRKELSIPQVNLRTITGTVVDEKENPIPGATVVIKNTSIGSSTNYEGRFTLQIPQDAKELLVSFIGLETGTIKLTESNDYKVVLKEVIEQMEEVVITGYQVIDRRKSTSSITTVKMNDIMIPGTTRVDQMLEGRIPDMMFMSNSGEVGVVPRLRIRGTSTLIGNREPLWVVDGVIVSDPVPLQADVLNDPDYVNRIGNAISGINPQDIERLDVLKDASATALYGTKAANGVIVITTKRGYIGKPTIRYNHTSTFKLRPRYTDRKIDLMNSKERINLSRELAAVHYAFLSPNLQGYEKLLDQLYKGHISQDEFERQVDRLETVNTDWFKLLTEDSYSQQHSLSVSGGSNDVRFYSSLGYDRDNDVIKNAYNERYTTAMNLDIDFANNISASFEIRGNIETRKYAQDGIDPVNYAYETNRAMPAFSEDGGYEYYMKYKSNYGNFLYNILNELENSSKKQYTEGFSFKTNIFYRFKDYLNLNALVSYAFSNTEIEGYWGEKSWFASTYRGVNYGEELYDTSLLPYGGILSIDFSKNKSYTVRLQLNLNKYFGREDRHNINASFGYELGSTKYTGYSSVTRGYDKERGKKFISGVPENFKNYYTWLGTNVPNLADNLANVLSAYGSISYSYKTFFTFNANTRYDGSNKFGSRSNEKLLPVWSVSGAYNISEHDFIQKDFIDFISIKSSFGYQGNMLDGQTPVMLIRKGTLDPYYNEFTSSVSAYANPNLKWEKTTSFNVGVEFGLFQKRIQISAEYYRKKTKDAYMNKPISDINGLKSYVVNSGEISNNGFNLSLTLIPVRSQNFYWMFSTSYSKTYNKSETLPGQETNELNDFLTGKALVKNKPVGTFYSYKFMGLSPVDGGPLFDDYEERVDELEGLTKYEVFTKVLKSSGRREPFMSGNLYNTLRYKNLIVNINLAYSLGAKVRLFKLYNGTSTTGNDIRSDVNANKIYLKRWQKPGDEKHTDVPAIIGQNMPNSSYYSTHYSSYAISPIPQIAINSWDMYNYSDHRVVNGSYLKCNNLSFTYEFGDFLKRMHLQRLEVTCSATNLFTICSSKLKGQTPLQSGFAEVQLSDRPYFTFGFNFNF